MSPEHLSPSHRFVVVYRREAREIAYADEVWRGWVERIPDPKQREHAGQTEERLGFRQLDELVELIERLIDSANRGSTAGRGSET